MSMYVDACGLFILSDAKKEHILIFSIDTVTLNFEKLDNLENIRNIRTILTILQKDFDVMFHVRSGKCGSIFEIYHE
mgnify:CR=1 FL=1